MESFESLDNQTKRSTSSNKSRIRIVQRVKELIKDENSDCDDENGKFNSKLRFNEENIIFSQFNLSTSMTVKEQYMQIHLFDMIDFDKLGPSIY